MQFYDVTVHEMALLWLKPNDFSEPVFNHCAIGTSAPNGGELPIVQLMLGLYRETPNFCKF